MNDVNKNYKLEDRFLQNEGRVFLTGTQALVRLPLMQRQIDLYRSLLMFLLLKDGG